MFNALLGRKIIRVNRILEAFRRNLWLEKDVQTIENRRRARDDFSDCRLAKILSGQQDQNAE